MALVRGSSVRLLVEVVVRRRRCEEMGIGEVGALATESRLSIGGGVLFRTVGRDGEGETMGRPNSVRGVVDELPLDKGVSEFPRRRLPLKAAL